MASAVGTNPTLAAQRQRLSATREALPQAWSEALPQVSISAAPTRPTATAKIRCPEGDRESRLGRLGQRFAIAVRRGRVIATTRAARAQIAGAVADYDDALQTLLLDVTRAYADVRQAQAVVAARETTVSNLTRLLEYAQAQFDAGVVTRTDVAQAKRARRKRARNWCRRKARWRPPCRRICVWSARRQSNLQAPPAAIGSAVRSCRARSTPPCATARCC